MQTCPKCGGDETIECPKCEGTGKTFPETLSGITEQDCIKCSGSGEVNCPKCKGRGEI
jgi:DnaJ-class molecular chaperone